MYVEVWYLLFFGGMWCGKWMWFVVCGVVFGGLF